VAVAVLMLVGPVVPRTQAGAQTGDDDATKNAQLARKALDTMVQALAAGVLDMKNQVREGHIAAFYHVFPTPARLSTGSSTNGRIMIAWS